MYIALLIHWSAWFIYIQGKFKHFWVWEIYNSSFMNKFWVTVFIFFLKLLIYIICIK